MIKRGILGTEGYFWQHSISGLSCIESRALFSTPYIRPCMADKAFPLLIVLLKSDLDMLEIRPDKGSDI